MRSHFVPVYFLCEKLSPNLKRAKSPFFLKSLSWEDNEHLPLKHAASVNALEAFSLQQYHHHSRPTPFHEGQNARKSIFVKQFKCASTLGEPMIWTEAVVLKMCCIKHFWVMNDESLCFTSEFQLHMYMNGKEAYKLMSRSSLITPQLYKISLWVGYPRISFQARKVVARRKLCPKNAL